MKGAAAGKNGQGGRGRRLGNTVLSAAHTILDDARVALTDPALTGPEAVHELRKAFKRWRALLRLLAPPLGEPAIRMRAEGRELMRAIAGARDAQAALDALEDLGKSGEAHSAPWIRTATERLTRLRNEAQAASLNPDLRGQLSDYLDRAATLIEQWPVCIVTFDTIADRITDTYRRARRLRPESWVGSEAAQLHELRRRVVELRHQMELVAPLSPRLATAWMRQAQRLRDRLGACQDLEVLARFAGPQGLLAPWRLRILPGIEARRAVHARAAARIARRLLAPKPKALRARLAALCQPDATKES